MLVLQEMHNVQCVMFQGLSLHSSSALIHVRGNNFKCHMKLLLSEKKEKIGIPASYRNCKDYVAVEELPLFNKVNSMMISGSF